MSDLIERLRGPSPSIPAMRDAADEIERLRQWELVGREWIDKTDWMQSRDAPVRWLGKHRADALREEIERLTAAQADVRPCTCHPDDSPPVPCAKKYALNECRAAAQADERVPLTDEQIEAQIEARDALLDFISENGTASEGVQHYLDRYVRAALAAKEN